MYKKIIAANLITKNKSSYAYICEQMDDKKADHPAPSREKRALKNARLGDSIVVDSLSLIRARYTPTSSRELTPNIDKQYASFINNRISADDILKVLRQFSEKQLVSLLEIYPETFPINQQMSKKDRSDKSFNHNRLELDVITRGLKQHATFHHLIDQVLNEKRNENNQSSSNRLT